jgi:DNA-binding NtrC family response regulator
MLHHIHVPPLREKRDDIPRLVEFFLQKSADELNKVTPTPPPELFTLLSVYDFPGNIRELQAMIFDAVSRHESGKLSLSSFKEIIQHHPSLEPTGSSAATVTIETMYASLEKLPTLKESEAFLIKEALKRADDNQTLAAMLLGITRQTLHNRLQTKK